MATDRAFAKIGGQLGTIDQRRMALPIQKFASAGLVSDLNVEKPTRSARFVAEFAISQ
jgi:hypothetical protein